MTLLICPVRPGDDNEELRYAMRSWEQNLILPDMDLLVIGYCPTWVNPDWYVQGNQYRSLPFAVFDNVLRAAQWAVDSRVTEQVIYMNDDFFCLDPQGSVLPVKRNVTLAQHIEQFPVNAGSWWPKSLRLTASWLASEGYPSPDSYEVHRPLVAQPQAMLDALSRWDLDSNDTVPQWRTVYGVLNEVHAYPVQDVKLGNKNTGVGSPWISTSDQSWRLHSQAIKRRFQKPSRWERT